ncbi:MAG: septal ring lytic transglycosylase RlpA family protein [Solirubrobacteraceae bacterium]
MLRPARDVGVHHGRRAVLSGVLAPRTPGRAVTLEQHRHGTWSRVARATTDARGVFRFRFTPKEVGSWPLRVRFGGDRANAGTVRRVGRLNSFRSSLASWYGAYGGAVACGGTLGYNEMGVAHKWLPCGTRLTIRYHGRTVQAKVIDRGPYAGGASSTSAAPWPASWASAGSASSKSRADRQPSRHAARGRPPGRPHSFRDRRGGA